MSGKAGPLYKCEFISQVFYVIARMNIEVDSR